MVPVVELDNVALVSVNPVGKVISTTPSDSACYAEKVTVADTEDSC